MVEYAWIAGRAAASLLSEVITIRCTTSTNATAQRSQHQDTKHSLCGWLSIISGFDKRSFTLCNSSPRLPHFVGGAHMTTPYSPRAVSPMTVDRPVGRQAGRSWPDHFSRITRHVRDIDASRVRHSIGSSASDRSGRATRQVLEHKNKSGSHRLRQDSTPCSSVLNLCSRCLSLRTHASPPKAIIFHGLRPTKNELAALQNLRWPLWAESLDGTCPVTRRRVTRPDCTVRHRWGRSQKMTWRTLD